jgi:hypothetical protein
VTRAPALVILEADGWIARQLADLAAESAWLVRPARTVDSALSLVRERQPCVLFVQVELAEDAPAPLRLIADLSRELPDVPIVAVSDVKLNDADRVQWAAALYDLGSRLALFPPLTQPVLEDAASGLLAAAIRRTVGFAPASAKPTAPKPRRKRAEPVIDLADEELHE